MPVGRERKSMISSAVRANLRAVKRIALPVVQPSRRDLCTGVLAGALGLFIAGCVDAGDGVGTGSTLPESDDLDGGLGADSGLGGDAGLGATCSGGEVDVGPPSMFAATPVLISASQVYVVRDAGGLYALSSRCTHNNVGLGVSSGRFRCPRHGALFTVDGVIISGPVSRGLVHYSLCILGNGHVGLNRSVPVANAVRLRV
jgi:nitrite reductase/ring-hydroxylating ferredoxin subunit